MGGFGYLHLSFELIRDSGYDAMEDTLDEFLNDVHVETVSNLAASTEFSAQMAGDMSYANGEKWVKSEQ